MSSLPRQGGNLWGPLVSHQSRKEGWPCLILYGLLKPFPPVSASTGPRTLPDRAPSLENRPPLHFPALVGMTGWAQGLLEWSPMSLTGLALGRAIHLRDVAGLLGL